MADGNGSGALISELRRMAESGTVDEQTFRRMMLAGLADLYERVAEWDDHEHTDTSKEIQSLKERDTRTLALALVVALAALAAALGDKLSVLAGLF